jgi:hypothetical protein
MKIVAFGHEKRVGKDTVANFLATYLSTRNPGLKILKAGFADKLKDVCHKLFAWAGLQEGGYYELPETLHLKEEKLPALRMSPRETWIAVGTQMRTIYEDVWLDALLKQADVDVLVIPDLRYPNEVNRILNEGGLVFKVTRPGLKRSSDVADDSLLNYRRWTGTIVNDGSLEDLLGKTIRLADTYL